MVRQMAACAKIWQLLDDDDIGELKKLIIYLGDLGEAAKRGDDVRTAAYAAIAEFERATGISFVELDRPVADLFDAAREEIRRRKN
jgi:hypothetical protein